MHKVSSAIVVPLSLAEAWDFFATPNNLKELTPPKMKMTMLDKQLPKMYEGMMIRYNVSPLLGIKMRWSSEISKIEEKSYFVDSMIEGPFSVWHHQHFFNEVEKGTEIKDIVHYKVPFGLLGELFHPWLVKSEVEEIFEYRKARVQELFGKI